MNLEVSRRKQLWLNCFLWRLWWKYWKTLSQGQSLHVAPACRCTFDCLFPCMQMADKDCS